MHIGFYSYTKQFNKNKIFLDPNSPLGDNLIYPFVYFGQQLKKLGHTINTLDMDKLENFDAIIFLEFPTFKNPYFKDLVKRGFKNLYLIILESSMIKPDNYLQENHTYFKKVFTFADNFIDNKKYFKINYSHQIPDVLDFSQNNNKRLCAMIAGNKSFNHKDELYSERIKAIRWFENNHPNDFDLFGIGWDRYYFHGKFMGVNLAKLNRIPFLTKLMALHYSSYKGPVASKHETYKNYKFSICYENSKDSIGYITEKIFDCFLAGCVPIYLGAQNITDHIPGNTFIDKKKFKTYQELYTHISNMPDNEYLEYIHAITSFLHSDAAHPFSAEYFANTLIKEITT